MWKFFFRFWFPPSCSPHSTSYALLKWEWGAGVALLVLLFSIDIELEEVNWRRWVGGRSCAGQHKRKWRVEKSRWQGRRRIIASFWMWQEQRAPASRDCKIADPLASSPSFSSRSLLVCVCVCASPKPMISYKYLMTAAVGRLLSLLLVHDDDDDDGRNPLNALLSHFSLLLLLLRWVIIIKCTHSIYGLCSIVRTTKMQDGWTDNGSIEIFMYGRL